MAKVTISQIKKNPAEFLYLFAIDAFLNKIDSKSAAIIKGKRTRQAKILQVACADEGKEYATVVKELNDILISDFGHSGAECLKILADGGEIAGKNWSKGIYGIGATTYEGFSGTDITVDAQTGKLKQGGIEIAGQTAVYGKNSTTYTATVNGTTYTSQYKKGKYSAGTYTTVDGKTFTPTGQTAGLSDFSNIWTSIQSFSPMIENFINWLISMFPASFENTSLITKNNTVPSQSDGFVQSSSIDGWTVGAAAGIAALVFFLTGGRKGKKK